MSERKYTQEQVMKIVSAYVHFRDGWADFPANDYESRLNVATGFSIALPDDDLRNAFGITEAISTLEKVIAEKLREEVGSDWDKDEK